MTTAETSENQPRVENYSRFDWRFILMLTVLAAAGALSVALILGFAADERDQDLRRWQDKLALIADSRAQAIENWLAQQREEIGGLAQNTSVQLFLTDLQFSGGNLSQVPDADGQLDYIGNLFLVAGARSGFLSEPDGPSVNANVQYSAAAGLALLDPTGEVLLATPGFQPPMLPEAAFKTAGPVLAPLRLDEDGRALLLASAQIPSLQGSQASGDQVGFVVGSKPALVALRGLLRQPGLSGEGLDIQLLQQEGAGLRFVLPTTTSEAPLSRSLALDTPEAAAAFAYLQPRGFAERRNRENATVLVTGRRIEGLPWTVMVAVDRAEALGPGEARTRVLLISLFLGLAFIAALIAFVWRHGASRRARAAAQRYRETAEALAEQQALLRLVTDNQPTSIFTLDAQDRYHFANRKAAEDVGLAEADLLGKRLDAVLGPAAAADYAEANESARRKKQPIARTLEWDDDKGSRSKIVSHIPVPKGDTTEMLIVEYDISEAVRQRRQQERTLNDLVMTLIGVVDRRDPYAANHSRRVAQLAELLSAEMNLGEVEIESARIAGSLMNLGKILIPEELLTKEGSLSEQELAAIRGAQQMSAELLEGVGFRGQVAETLRQAQEHFDGTGSPRGLSGDEILPTARILSVANAFVGMVSPRSWRSNLTVDTAIEELLRQSGKHFDQRVIAALLNYLENKGGREVWDAREGA